MLMDHAPGKSPSRIVSGEAFRLFLANYLFVASLFTAIFQAVLWLNANSDLRAVKVAELAKVRTTREIMAYRLEMEASDLRAIARAPAISFLAARNDPAQRAIATSLFHAFSSEKKIYSQIRYLDASGREVVRVDQRDGKPLVIPDGPLQDRSQRNAFRDAVSLPAGGVHVSPLDLNIEHNRIRIPYEPVIRFGTPVFSPRGERGGVLLLNVDGRALILLFRDLMRSGGQAMLVNRDGDWLAAPDRRLEWGFMFGRPAGFARRHPAAWRAMSGDADGHWLDEAGLFSYATVHPLRNGGQSPGGSPPAAGAHDHYWKVVSLVPRDALPSASITRNRATLSVYAGSLFLLLLATAYQSRATMVRRQLRREILRNNRLHKEITDNLGEGLVVIGRDGRIAEANPEAGRMLGWSREEMLGRDAHALFHTAPEDMTPEPIDPCPIQAVASAGGLYSNEDETFYQRDGTALPVSVRASALASEDGLTGAVMSFRDMREIRRYEEEIRQMAYHDPLTGLPNRRLLINNIALAIGLADRNDRQLAVMFLDLDHFKAINDSYGHDGGDALLRGVADRLRQSVRATDTVARQGGDEFIILMPEIGSPEDAIIVARKILARLSEPLPVQGNLLTISASIGIALYPDHGRDVIAIMQAADAAMYMAKETGRNRYCLRDAALLT